MTATSIKPNQMDATTRLASKIITITRDGTAATGSVAYTGVGFTPTSMEVTFVVNDTVFSGRGFCDSSLTEKSTFTYAADLYLAGDYFIAYTDKNNWGQTCTVTSFDADGFTLAWTKAGSPTAGTITAQVRCFR